MQGLRNAHRTLRTPACVFRGGRLGVWYDFSDSSTMFSDAGGAVITDGGTVYTLHDKSGNANTVIQATSGARPTWNKAGYLAFDSTATADALARAGGIQFADGGRLPEEFTVLALVSGTPAVGTYFVSLGGGGAGPSLSFGTNNATSTTLSAFIRSDSGASGQTNTTPIVASAFSATPQVIGVSFQGLATSTRMIATLNGNRAVASGSDISGTYTINQFTIGGLGRFGSVASHMTINIYQLLLINRTLSQSEIAFIIDDWKKRAAL
jgi:hypothetical protein